MDIPTGSIESLTKREREILSLIGQGLSLAEIAEKLFRSQKTIQTHRLSLGRKLGASNRVKLARIAIQAGLSPLDHEEPVTAQLSAKAREQLAFDSPAGQALQEIDARLASHVGQRYFNELVRTLCEVLAVRAASLCELTPVEGRLRCVAAHDEGRTNIAHYKDCEADACTQTLEEGFAEVVSGLREAYANTPNAQFYDADAYLGVRLGASAEDAIGVLCILHDGEIDRSKQPGTILQICASRATAELARLRASNAVLEAIDVTGQQTRQLVDALAEGVYLTDADGQITYANNRFCKMIGEPSDEVIGHMPTQWIQSDNGSSGKYRALMTRKGASDVKVIVSPSKIENDPGQAGGELVVVTEVLGD